MTAFILLLVVLIMAANIVFYLDAMAAGERMSGEYAKGMRAWARVHLVLAIAAGIVGVWVLAQ